MIETGCRAIELRSLFWADIDLDNLIVKIRKGIERQSNGSYKKKTTKTEIIQDKAMSRYTASLLQKLKKENDSFIKNHDKLIKEKGDWVFINT